MESEYAILCFAGILHENIACGSCYAKFCSFTAGRITIPIAQYLVWVTTVHRLNNCIFPQTDCRKCLFQEIRLKFTQAHTALATLRYSLNFWIPVKAHAILDISDSVFFTQAGPVPYKASRKSAVPKSHHLLATATQ